VDLAGARVSVRMITLVFRGPEAAPLSVNWEEVTASQPLVKSTIRGERSAIGRTLTVRAKSSQGDPAQLNITLQRRL
jgi:hypothetical protein